MTKDHKHISESRYYSFMGSIKHQHIEAFWICSILLMIAFTVFCFIFANFYAGFASLGIVLSTGLLLWQRKRLIQYQEILIMIFALVCYDGILYILFHIITLTSVTNAFFLGYSFAFLHLVLQSKIINLWNVIKMDLVLFVGRSLIVSQLNFTELRTVGFVIHVVFNILYMFILFEHQKAEEKLLQHTITCKEQVTRTRDKVFNHIPDGMFVLAGKYKKVVYTNHTFDKISSHVLNQNDFLTVSAKDQDVPECLEKMRVEKNSFTRKNLQNFFSKKYTSMNKIPNLLNIINDLIDEGLLKDEPTQFRVTHTDTLGHKKLYEVKVFRTTWNTEEAFATILDDITDQEAAVYLRMTDANKDKIISTVSHEFRTPLNGILGILHILEKNVMDHEIAKYVSLCKSNASLLLSVANTMLDVQQIREGKFKLHCSKFNLCNMLEEVKSLFDFQCNSKEIYLKFMVQSSVPKFIFTDINRLKQVLINLIGNAIKFTFDGGIVVTIQEDPDNQDCIQFCISDTGVGIADEDKFKLFKMFGKLEKTENINQGGTGLGLMISDTLSRLLNTTKKEKGIKLESQIGQGSKFYFTISKNLRRSSAVSGDSLESDDHVSSESLKSVEDKINSYTLSLHRTSIAVPTIKYNIIHGEIENTIFHSIDSPKKLSVSHAYLDPEQTMLNSRSDSRKSALLTATGFSLTNSKPDRRLSIFKPRGESPKSSHPLALIVDDNPFNIMVAQHLVQSNGFKVKTAFNGKTALEMVKKQSEIGQPFKVIFMDYEMPIMNGIEATKTLNQMIKNGECPFVPVVALTAHEKAEEKKKCMDCGMIDVLAKPMDDKKLSKILEALK